MNNRQNRINATMIARAAAACCTLAFVGWFNPSPTTAPVPGSAVVNAGSAAPVQVAGLLVPKRTRIVIKFERTAVC